MELQLDFSSHLPEHLTPGYDKVVSLLTQTVPQWPRGAAMLTRERKGIFNIKIWDKSKAALLLGQKVEYYYEGDKSSKKVSVKIQERPKNMRYKNPKYVTMMGFDRYPAEKISNEQLDTILSNYGSLIVRTQDVFADVFLTGKKKARIDLNKDLDIPRDMFAEFSGEDGKKFSITIRTYYKEQPYLCKRCRVNHVGDCPEWVAQKLENERVKKVKLENSKTVLIGDSNFRCVNERGVMASVTAVTGGKIGHICNQTNFENLEKIENVVLSAGQNCLNDVEEVEKENWEQRTTKEVYKLETTVKGLVDEGKQVFLFPVPPVPMATASKVSKEARSFINKKIAAMVQKVSAKQSPGSGKVTILQENDGNFTASTDFVDERHLSPLAMEKRIGQLDEILPTGNKLKTTILGEHSTCKPYGGCYGTYPVGCMFCTELNHNETECPVKNKKINLSSNSKEQGGKNKQSRQ